MGNKAFLRNPNICPYSYPHFIYIVKLLTYLAITLQHDNMAVLNIAQ